MAKFGVVKVLAMALTCASAATAATPPLRVKLNCTVYGNTANSTLIVRVDQAANWMTRWYKHAQTPWIKEYDGTLTARGGRVTEGTLVIFEEGRSKRSIDRRSLAYTDIGPSHAFSGQCAVAPWDGISGAERKRAF